MELYHYDPETGEYRGSREARLDPLESRKAGEPRYLIPANATTEAPPLPRAGFVPCWRDGAWQQIEDHRGKAGWIDGAPSEVARLGPLPNGWSEEPPPPPEPTPEDRLAETDADMARVVEDLVDLLERKGIISRSELPEAAQQRIAERMALREALGG